MMQSWIERPDRYVPEGDLHLEDWVNFAGENSRYRDYIVSGRVLNPQEVILLKLYTLVHRRLHEDNFTLEFST